MKILHIPTGGLFTDGIFSCIYEYAKILTGQGYQMDVLAVNEPAIECRRKMNDLGQQVIEIPYRRKNPVKYLWKLFVYLKKHPYDAVHVHGSSGLMSIELLAAWLAGCKVRIAHSHNTHCQNKKADRVLRPLFLRLYTHAFACGKDAGNWLFPDRKFFVIPNGRDLDLYAFQEKNRISLRKRYGIERDTLVLGHVGRFNEQKNQKYLLEIFREVKKLHEDTKLVLVGTGEMFSEVNELAENMEFGKDVLFLGNQENVPEILSMMDKMILPSLFEGLPIVVVEWQAAGLPCFISDTVTRECVVMENVWMGSILEDPGIWAKAVLQQKTQDRAAARESVKEKMRLAGYDIFENASQLGKLYHSFVQEKGKL